MSQTSHSAMSLKFTSPLAREEQMETRNLLTLKELRNIPFAKSGRSQETHRGAISSLSLSAIQILEGASQASVTSSIHCSGGEEFYLTLSTWKLLEGSTCMKRNFKSSLQSTCGEIPSFHGILVGCIVGWFFSSSWQNAQTRNLIDRARALRQTWSSKVCGVSPPFFL